MAGLLPEEYQKDGRSLLPMLKGKEEEVQEQVFIHYSPRWGGKKFTHDRWIMNQEYKLYQDGRFFNTAKDSLEEHPLEKLSPAEQDLKARFQQIIDEKEQDVPFEMNNTEFKLTD